MAVSPSAGGSRRTNLRWCHEVRGHHSSPTIQGVNAPSKNLKNLQVFLSEYQQQAQSTTRASAAACPRLLGGLTRDLQGTDTPRNTSDSERSLQCHEALVLINLVICSKKLKPNAFSFSPAESAPQPRVRNPGQEAKQWEEAQQGIYSS